MALSITLYKNYSDNRVVNKNIEAVLTGTIELYDDSSIVAPIVRLIYDNNNVIPDANYAYIPQWKRYYYITNITALVGGGMAISMSCDVLMTYKGTILNSAQTIIRSESIGKPTMIPDENLPLAPYKDMKVIIFEGGYFNLNTANHNTYNFLLNVAGGGGYNPDPNSANRTEKEGD